MAQRQPTTPNLLRTGTAWALGLVLIASAILKAVHPWPALLSLTHLLARTGAQPDAGAGLSIVGLAACVEIGVGVWMIVSPGGRTVRWSAPALLGVFTLLSLVLVLDPAAPSCGCFGALRLAREAQVENRIALVRNLLLLSVSLWLATAPHAAAGTSAALPSARMSPRGLHAR